MDSSKILATQYELMIISQVLGLKTMFRLQSCLLNRLNMLNIKAMSWIIHWGEWLRSSLYDWSTDPVADRVIDISTSVSKESEILTVSKERWRGWGQFCMCSLWLFSLVRLYPLHKSCITVMCIISLFRWLIIPPAQPKWSAQSDHTQPLLMFNGSGFSKVN